jgi:hypothetical protein
MLLNGNAEFLSEVSKLRFSLWGEGTTAKDSNPSAKFFNSSVGRTGHRDIVRD